MRTAAIYPRMLTRLTGAIQIVLVIQVMHLLVGLGAIGQAERMAAEVLGPGASPVGA